MVARRILLGISLIGVIVVGCSSDLGFTIRFKTVEGLRTGDRLMAENLVLGSVQAVDYVDQGDYRVTVTVTRAHRDKLDHNSIFFIDADPQQPGRKALMVITSPASGAPIADGETLEGTSKWAALMQRMTQCMENTLAGLATELGQFWQDLRNLPSSEQAQRLEQEIDRILAELRHLSASARHELQTKILPRLRDQLEELRRKLGAPEYEDQFDRLQEKVDRIDRELQV